MYAYEAAILDDLFFNTSHDFLIDLDKFLYHLQENNNYA
jgi:hypothetical protein